MPLHEPPLAPHIGRWIFAALLTGCAARSGASAESDDGPTESSGGVAPSPCVPGRTLSCACEDGNFGTHTCRPDGDGFDACVCGGDDVTDASATASADGDDDAGSVGSDASTSSASSDESSDASTGAGADAVSDDFERSELGPDWGVEFPPAPGDDQVAILDDSDLGMLAGPQGFFLVNWRATAFAADQFSEATIPEDVADGWIHQVYVRWRADDRARYGFGYGGDSEQEVFGSWYFKYDGVPTAETRWVASAPADGAPQPGTTLRIEVEGFTLRGYVDGELVLEATDTDPSRIAAGEAGLAARWADGNQSTLQPVKVWESWSGGSL